MLIFLYDEHFPRKLVQPTLISLDKYKFSPLTQNFIRFHSVVSKIKCVDGYTNIMHIVLYLAKDFINIKVQEFNLADIF